MLNLCRTTQQENMYNCYWGSLASVTSSQRLSAFHANVALYKLTARGIVNYGSVS